MSERKFCNINDVVPPLYEYGLDRTVEPERLKGIRLDRYPSKGDADAAIRKLVAKMGEPFPPPDHIVYEGEVMTVAEFMRRAFGEEP